MGCNRKTVLVIAFLMFLNIIYIASSQTSSETEDGLFVFLNLDQNEVPKFSTFRADGQVLCKENGCREVTASLYYKTSPDSPPILIPTQPSSGHMYTTNQNPIQCQDLRFDESCHPTWSVTTNNGGNYFIIMNGGAVSSNRREHIENTTENKALSVLPGQIKTEIVLIDPSQINREENSNINGNIICETAPCDAVFAYLRYNDIIVSDNGDITTDTNQHPNPAVCEDMGDGETCQVFWTVTGRQTGSYTMTIRAESRDLEISPVVSQPQTLNVQNPSGGTGSLSLSSVSVSPNPINISQITVFSGVASCSTSYCGSVTAAARHNGQRINNTGNITTSDPNPVNCRFLPCSASWNIAGNSGGDFVLEFFARSNESSVNPVSEFRTLTVQAPSQNSGNPTPAPETLNIVLLQKTNTVARGEGFFIKVSVTKNNEIVTGAIVTASSDFFSLDLFDDGNHGDNNLNDGIYANNFKIPPTASEGIHTVTITAEKDLSEGFLQTEFSVNPVLDISIGSDKPNYITFDRAVVTGDVKRNFFSVNANVTLGLACGSYRKTLGLSQTDNLGNYFFEFPISAAIPRGHCSVTATAIDAYQNRGSNSISINIGASDLEIYNVVFLSPKQDETFESGDTVTIQISVLSGNRPVRNAIAFCNDPLGEPIISLEEKNPGIYSANYSIPKENLPAIWSLSCVAQTRDGFLGSGFINVNIRLLVPQIKIISPKQTSVFIGDTASFLIEVTYIDGTPIKNANVSLRLQNTSLYFEEAGLPGTYRLLYEFKEEGLFIFEIAAEDKSGGKATEKIAILSRSKGFEILVPSIIILLGFLGSALIWAKRRPVKVVEKVIYGGPAPTPYDRKTELTRRLKQLEARKATLEKAKDVAESAYYKRKIDEKTFKKMMEDYEEDLIKINVELIDIKRELARTK